MLLSRSSLEREAFTGVDMSQLRQPNIHQAINSEPRGSSIISVAAQHQPNRTGHATMYKYSHLNELLQTSFSLAHHNGVVNEIFFFSSIDGLGAVRLFSC